MSPTQFIKKLSLDVNYTANDFCIIVESQSTLLKIDTLMRSVSHADHKK